MDLVEKAIEMDSRSRSELTAAMKDLTSLDNPNSVQQMKQWLALQGVEVGSLGKKEVAKLIDSVPPRLREALELRQQLARSSVRKYQTMQRAVCEDVRARGMFAFYGANRTGRWAGRLIQLQNLPQNHLEDLSSARALVKSGDFEAVKMLYEDVPDTLSQLIRTAFIPKDGMLFYVADFSAIEARVIAWYAGEKWRQKVFEDGGDIYCASASQMFHVPVVKHGVNGHLRQKGKIAELALGYGGSVGALKAMGALEMGLSEDELPPLVDAWRQTNPPHRPVLVGCGQGRHERRPIPRPIHHLRPDIRLPLRHAVHPAALRQKTRVCEAEDRDEPVRRRMHHLRGHRRFQEMGTPRLLRSEIRGEHRAGHIPRHPVLCHEDAPLLPDRHARP
jgi:DNA polymerase bacteriophage-type